MTTDEHRRIAREFLRCTPDEDVSFPRSYKVEPLATFIAEAEARGRAEQAERPQSSVSGLRNLCLLDIFRMRGKDVIGLWGTEGDETCGAFLVPSPIDGAPIKVIASSGDGWDHVSASRQNRCPNHTEMEYVRGLFFKDEVTVVSYSVPRSEHINVHPFCLHMWRPHDADIPRPPGWMVGIKDVPLEKQQEAAIAAAALGAEQ